MVKNKVIVDLKARVNPEDVHLNGSLLTSLKKDIDKRWGNKPAVQANDLSNSDSENSDSDSLVIVRAWLRVTL